MELASELGVKTDSLDGKFGGLKASVEPEKKNQNIQLLLVKTINQY